MAFSFFPLPHYPCKRTHHGYGCYLLFIPRRYSCLRHVQVCFLRRGLIVPLMEIGGPESICLKLLFFIVPTWHHGDDDDIFNLHGSRMISRLLTDFTQSLLCSLLNVIAFDIFVGFLLSETAMKHRPFDK